MKSINMATSQTLVVVLIVVFIFYPGGVFCWDVDTDNDVIINDVDDNVDMRPPRHIIPPLTTPAPTLPPVFDPSVPNNVTVTATKTAILPCVVHNLGNNSVSWIRHRDLHILSVGTVTYTNDARFEAVPHTHQGNWLMRLRYAAPKDSGQYDCQISSTPPIARTVMLTVIEPRAKIISAPEMHVGLGSSINLTCVVSYSPEPPDYLHWYYKERMVREDGIRVWIKTQLDEKSVSQLVVQNAAPPDQGVYTCSPAHSIEHSITVHVLTGEYPAAMQGVSSVTCQGRSKSYMVTITVIILLIGFYSIPVFNR